MRVNEAIELIKDRYEGKVYGKELVLKECPYCQRNDGRFYININTGQANCKHASCGARTNLTGLFSHLGIDEHIEYNDAPKTHKEADKTPQISLSSVRPMEETDTTIIDYMMSRGISYDTLKRSDVRIGRQGAMTFVTTHKFKTVGCVYRTIDKKIFMERGSEQRLWGIDTFKFDDENQTTLYIAEGHPDCLTLREMGIWNSVTVPNGAASHDWIDRDWDFLQQFDKIVLCYDNDDAGKSAILDVKGRLDFANLYELEYGLYNDINEMYMMDSESLFNTVRHPKEISMDGFISLQNVSTEMGVMDQLVSTGLAGFDQIFGGIGLHQSSIIMAESGAGKTTVMANMIKGMLGMGQKVAVWSGELSNKMLKTWIYSTIGGENAINYSPHPFRKNEFITSIKPEYEKKIDKAVDGKLYVYDGNKSNAFKMIKHFEYLHKRFGVKYFFVDNLSILDMSVKGVGKYEGEEELSKAVAAFTRNNPVHIFLVAHPTKTAINSDPNFVDKSGRVKPIEKYTQQQVKGSSTLVNLIHNVLVLCRAKAHEKAYMAQKIEQQLTKANQQSKIPAMVKLMEEEFSLMAYLVKNRSGGFMYEDCLMGYDRRTRRIYGLQTKEEDLAVELLEEKVEEVVIEEFGYEDF